VVLVAAADEVVHVAAADQRVVAAVAEDAGRDRTRVDVDEVVAAAAVDLDASDVGQRKEFPRPLRKTSSRR